MTDIYLRGALIFAAFVVFAVTVTLFRNRYGHEPPEWQSYLTGVLLLGMIFLHLEFQSRSLALSDSGAGMAQAHGTQLLTINFTFAIFIVAWWILTEKKRMERYFDRMMRKEARGERDRQ